MSILPDDVMKKVEDTFTTKETRAVALELLTAWNRMPNWKEKAEVGGRHRRSDRTVHGVIQKLQELELFTEDEGSMPLLRLSLKREALTPSVRPEGVSKGSETVKTPEKGLLDVEVPQVSPAGYPFQDDVDEDVSDSQEVSEDDFKRLQREMDVIQSKIERLSRSVESIEPVIKGLSAKVTDNPSSDPVVPAESSKAGIPGPLNPFAGMSGDQVYEMYLNQPDAFAQLLGRPIPADAVAEGGMSALPATVRRIIVELTAYTQIAYEKAVNDGAFDGSLSDFLNQCAYKYFADRGIVLEWRRKPPGYPEQPYPRRYG